MQIKAKLFQNLWHKLEQSQTSIRELDKEFDTKISAVAPYRLMKVQAIYTTPEEFDSENAWN